jgi:hypothetical protein
VTKFQFGLVDRPIASNPSLRKVRIRYIATLRGSLYTPRTVRQRSIRSRGKKATTRIFTRRALYAIKFIAGIAVVING